MAKVTWRYADPKFVRGCTLSYQPGEYWLIETESKKVRRHHYLRRYTYLMYGYMSMNRFVHLLNLFNVQPETFENHD